MMKAAEAVLGTAAALFAVLPGVNSILSGAGATPGDEKLFGGVSVAVGVAVLLMISIFKPKVRRVARTKVVIVSIILLIIGVTMIATHVGVLSSTVVEYRIDDPPDAKPRLYVFPLRADGRLHGMITTAGGRLAALYRYGPDAIAAALLDGSNPLRVALSKGLLLFTFAAISACFSAALLILAYRLSSA